MPEVTFYKAELWQTPSGNWLALCLDKNHLSTAREFIDKMAEGKLFTAALKLFKPKRSLDANAYFWVLCGKVAAKISLPPVEVYRQLIPEIGGNYEIICVRDSAVDKLRQGWEHNGTGWLTDTMPSRLEGCTNVMLFYGSSTYDSAQMSRLIDLIVTEAKAQGIETMTPAELSALKDRWGDA